MRRALDAGLPPDALIHQDFEKQKSLSPLLRWPLPLIALSITPGGWSIQALPLCTSLPHPLLLSLPISPTSPSSFTLHCISFTSGSLQPGFMWENWIASPFRTWNTEQDLTKYIYSCMVFIINTKVTLRFSLWFFYHNPSSGAGMTVVSFVLYQLLRIV